MKKCRSLVLSSVAMASALLTGLAMEQGALAAEKLVMVSDTHGVRTDADDPNSLAATLAEQQLRDLIDQGVISSGMKPKVQSCLQALDAGVGKAHIIDGRINHSLLLEIRNRLFLGFRAVQYLISRSLRIQHKKCFLKILGALMRF